MRLDDRALRLAGPPRISVWVRGRLFERDDHRANTLVGQALEPALKPHTPHCSATCTWRRTVYGSSPSCAARRFFGIPMTHRRSTSLISIIVISRYAMGSPDRLARRPGDGYSSRHAGGNAGEKLSRPRGECR